MININEHDLQTLIMVALSKHGDVFRINNGAFYTKDGRFIPRTLPKGHSDLVFYRNGLASFIEVKVKPNNATADQLRFIDRMRKNGCNAGVAYSVEEALKVCRII